MIRQSLFLLPMKGIFVGLIKTHNQQVLLFWKGRSGEGESQPEGRFPPQVLDEIVSRLGLRVLNVFDSMPLVLMSGRILDIDNLAAKLNEMYDGAVTAEAPRIAVIQEYRGPMSISR